MSEKINVTFKGEKITFKFYNRKPYVEVDVTELDDKGQRYGIGIPIHIESVFDTEGLYNKAAWAFKDPEVKKFVREYILQNLYRYKSYFNIERKKWGL